MFIPPINLGQFQPSPATLADWIYQIWNYLQNNPIATQEQLQEYIATFITTSPETQELIGEGVEQYLTDNPPQAPVQSVQGKTGAVTLAFNDILKNNNTAPVYRAASMPSQSTLQAQYNLGYRLFVNTSTQEIYSITNLGATTLVGKGKFDGTTVDLDTAQGDTTIAEAITDITTDIDSIISDVDILKNVVSTSWTENGVTFDAKRAGRIVTITTRTGTNSIALSANGVLTNIPTGYRPSQTIYLSNASAATSAFWAISASNGNISYAAGQSQLAAGGYVRFCVTYITDDGVPA